MNSGDMRVLIVGGIGYLAVWGVTFYVIWKGR